MILFLDDEPHYVQAYVDALEDADFVVQVVTTTDEFLRLLSRATKAVVIDVMLPEGIDAGIVAFRAMRRDFPHLPAILFTNRADMDFGQLDDRAMVVSKREILPGYLVELIKKITCSG
jgi:DNA-binding NtrC family response regulator